ncbi:MAG: Ig-like domain repeat protein, partial [Actinomycetota bacterium]
VNGHAGSTSITVGDNATITATIAPASATDTTTPTGTVTFYDGTGQSNLLGTATLSGGVATLAPNPTFSQATHTITADYSGDGFYSGSTGTFTLTVNAGAPQTIATTTKVTTSPTVIRTGGLLTITAAISQNGSSSHPLGGLVQFLIDGQPAGAAIALQLLGSSGTAILLNVGGWNPGVHTITAQYQGDTFNTPSTGQITITVLDNKLATLTLTGPATTVVRTATTLSAKLTGTGGAPIAGQAVTLTAADGETCTATTAADGTMSCGPFTFAHAGPMAITLASAGDATYGPGAGTGSITVQPATSTIVYTGAARAGTNQPATLSAHLTALGAPLAGRHVVLTLNGNPAEQCAGDTDSNGNVSCTVTVSEAASTTPYAVTASFAGDGDDTAATATGALTVSSQQTTTLTYTGSTSAAAGGSAALSFFLADANGHAVASEPISITLNSVTYTATTGSNGIATVTVTAPAAGDYTVAGSFAGDAAYASSTGSGRLHVTGLATTIGYLGPLSATFGSKVYLSGYLLSGTTPLSGKTVTLSLPNNGGSCTATTFLGIAVCTTPLTLPNTPGVTLTVTVSFAGDSTYAPSTGTGSLAIPKAATTLTLDAVTAVQYGGSVTLGATLTRSADNARLAGKSVTLTFGTQSCTATTDASGHATCSVTRVGAPYGTKTAVTATFDGDSAYLASSAKSGSNPCVFGSAPGHGLFVIGDRTSWNSSITFWGSQWSKSNSLSYGSPSSFKGFGDDDDDDDTPTCNASWTSRTGNSTPPPAGPLPPYMAVVVSSKVTQNGSVISGDVKKVVIVATNGGYDSNPGHAGTGNVVAVLCGG